MALVQKRLAQFGIAKQSAKGSAASAATYHIGVTGGNIIGAEVEENDLDVTWSGRLTEGFERNGITPMAEFDSIVTPKILPLLLFGACGANATTGASAPYTHTATTSSDLPYLTLFGTYGTEFYKVTDAKLDSLELSWDQTSALKMKPKFIGAGLSFPGTVYTVTNNERVADGTFRGQGGTFTFDGASATVKSGSITISNNVEAVFGSADVIPVDVFPGLQTVEFSLVVYPTDLTTWRKMLTGATNGTTLTSSIYAGSASIKHVLDANTDVTFSATNARIMTEFPEADPSGGPAEITIEGKVGIPAGGGNPYSFATRNAVASY